MNEYATQDQFETPQLQPVSPNTTLIWKLSTALLLVALVGSVAWFAFDKKVGQIVSKPDAILDDSISAQANPVASVVPSTKPQLDPALTPFRNIGLAMKIPNELYYYQPFIEVVVSQPYVTGSTYCLTFTRTAHKDRVPPCGDNDVKGGATSIDNDAGREFGTMDIQGYTYENGKFIVNVFSKKIEVPSRGAKEMTSAGGVPFLLIPYDETLPVEDMPTLWPNKGEVTAVVKTKSETYPALVMQAKVENGTTQEVFESFLMSLQYYP